MQELYISGQFLSQQTSITFIKDQLHPSNLNVEIIMHVHTMFINKSNHSDDTILYITDIIIPAFCLIVFYKLFG